MGNFFHFLYHSSIHTRRPLSFNLSSQNPVCTSPLPHTWDMPAQLIPFDLIILITCGEQYKWWRSSLSSFLQAPVTSSLFSPNTFLRIQLSSYLLSTSFLMCDTKFCEHKNCLTIFCMWQHTKDLIKIFDIKKQGWSLGSTVTATVLHHVWLRP